MVSSGESRQPAEWTHPFHVGGEELSAGRTIFIKEAAIVATPVRLAG